MKAKLLALTSFVICITSGFSQNLRSFVVLLHDFPLKVEKAQIYSTVKNWRSASDIEEDLNAPHSLPEAYPLEEKEGTSCRFFKQSRYKDKPKEEVRLLCWGKCHSSQGYFGFKLPEVVSTRFISLVCTGVYSYSGGNESVNVDIMKFIPCGAIVPCL